MSPACVPGLTNKSLTTPPNAPVTSKTINTAIIPEIRRAEKRCGSQSRPSLLWRLWILSKVQTRSLELLQSHSNNNENNRYHAVDPNVVRQHDLTLLVGLRTRTHSWVPVRPAEGYQKGSTHCRWRRREQLDTADSGGLWSHQSDPQLTDKQ